MDLAAIQSFLAGFFLTLLGFSAPADPVVWQDEPRPQDNGRVAILSWVSIPKRGVDEVRYEDSGAAAPAVDLTPVVMGNRVLVLQLAVETLTQSADGPNATALLNTARTRLARPSAKAALLGANLALVDAVVITLANRAVDDHVIARAVLEVRLNAADGDRDTDGATSSIATVELASDTLKNVDGADVPPALQISEVIP
jgi:hypothetical protein